MRVLALDTTTRAGSVAVVDNDRVLFAAAGDPRRSHAERLPGDLIQAMAAAGLVWSDLDLFAVGSGPGSFTGLRIGIATMQGLAFVCRKPMVPVSALTALAYGAAASLSPGDLIGSWMDAHRREVFSALHRVHDAPGFTPGRLEEIEAAVVGDPAATWQRWSAPTPPLAIVGDGAVLYREVVPAGVSIIAPPLLAPIIAALALARAERGEAVDPAAVHPLYVRRPDAEIARDALLDAGRH